MIFFLFQIFPRFPIFGKYFAVNWVTLPPSSLIDPLAPAGYGTDRVSKTKGNIYEGGA